MRKLYLLLFFLSYSYLSLSQTTVFSENFDVSQGATYTSVTGPIGTSPIWKLIQLADGGARIDGGILDLTNDATVGGGTMFQAAYGHVDFTNFVSPFNPILDANSGLITWTFNMRQIRPDPSGFGFSNYGVAYILAANASLQGYAVMLGQSLADPIRLARVSGSLASFTNIIIATAPGFEDIGNEYLSVKVTFDPATDIWELFVRIDGAAFLDPSLGTLTSVGTGTDNTYIGSTMVNMGGFWNSTNASANQTAFFDNVKVSVNAVAPNTITSGTVSTPPFILATCASTVSGTVAFTSTDNFPAGNVFTAQLSDASGSFASPVNIGTLPTSGTAPSGNIPITIPAATTTGGGYKIRVVSSNPVVTGTESAAFTITQNGIGCSTSPTDHYRTVQNGLWQDVNTWESSYDGSNWIPSTMVPGSAANTITILSGHSVAILSNADADQLTIQGGANLVFGGGTFIINDGTGDDLTIEAGGSFTLSSTNPTFSGSSVCRVMTDGIFRFSVGGLTQAGMPVHTSSVVFEHSSILEYAAAAAFSSTGITYFPNAGPAVIPIFRLTTSVGLIGGGASTTWNGVFECNGSLNLANAGDKIFRNGVRGSGTINTSAGVGKIIINGVTAELGGTVDLNFGSASALEIGAPTLVTVTANQTINGNVRILSDSYVELGPFNITVTGVFLDPVATGYVKTNGTGWLEVTDIQSGGLGKLLNVGLTTSNPVYINSDVLTSYTARIVEPITPPIYNENGAVFRTWYISSSYTGTTPPDPGSVMTFYYSNGTDIGPQYDVDGPVQIGVNVANVWNIIETGVLPSPSLFIGTQYGATSGQEVIFNAPYNEFPFVVANPGAILSLDCIIFARSQKQNGKGLISWEVSNCDEVSEFIIERAVNGGVYQHIGSIVPNNELRYQFVDDSPQRGLNSYRIRVNGITGDHKYSNIVLVFNEEKGILFTVAPNPVRESARITIHSARAGKAAMKLVNASGAVIRQWTTDLRNGTHYEEITLNDLPAGTYLLYLESEAGIYSRMLLKQ